MMPTVPSVSRKATRSSLSTRNRTGVPSGSGSSSASSTGCQKRRNNSPIGVPGPVRVRSSLSLKLSIRHLQLADHPLLCYLISPALNAISAGP